ncbi:hypothetical protein [Lysinibacillus sp. NPDC056185]
MDLLIAFLVFVVGFELYDAIRKVDNNILEQAEEIKKLREELAKGTNN